jgi:ribonuclease D
MFGTTPLVIIDTTEALDELIDKLLEFPVIGIDTEGDSLHHYQERVSLVQLSDSSTDYIVDPLKVDDMSRLGELTSHPDQVTVLHGGDYDVVSLKRDFGCQFANIFDTMIASQFLGLPRIGLADLIKRFFGHHIDKKYQRHDWSSRPLESEHLDYARGDTHWLLAIREMLKRQLVRMGMEDAHREECDLLALREWGGRGGSSGSFLRVKKSNGLSDQELRVLRAVWTYRDDRARSMDRPSFKVMPDEVLLNLAKKQPSSLEVLKKMMRPGSSLVRRHGDALVEAVAAGLEDKSELPIREPKKARVTYHSRVGRAGAERIFNALKAWRNHTVQSKKVAPVVVASNDLLKAIARTVPTTMDELGEVPGIRRWQIKSFGPEIIDIVAGLELPVQEDKPKSKKRRRRRRGGTKDAAAPQSEDGGTASPSDAQGE